MLLIWGLIRLCCLALLIPPFVGACSWFSNHICCASSNSPSVILSRDSLPAEMESKTPQTSSTSEVLPKSLRILCFGDSLTAGYTNYGLEFFPYADHLRAGLQRMLSTPDIEIDVDGFSGDQVQGSYLPRIRRKCAKTGTSYDWIVVMGGTNDLGWGQSPEKIYEGLRKLIMHFNLS